MDTSHGWAAVVAAARRSRAIRVAVLLAACFTGCHTDPKNPFPAVLNSDEPYALSVPDDGEPVLLGFRSQSFDVEPPVFVEQEDILTVVASLGDVMRCTDRHHPGSGCGERV